MYVAGVFLFPARCAFFVGGRENISNEPKSCFYSERFFLISKGRSRDIIIASVGYCTLRYHIVETLTTARREPDHDIFEHAGEIKKAKQETPRSLKSVTTNAAVAATAILSTPPPLFHYCLKNRRCSTRDHRRCSSTGCVTTPRWLHQPALSPTGVGAAAAQGVVAAAVAAVATKTLIESLPPKRSSLMPPGVRARSFAPVNPTPSREWRRGRPSRCTARFA